MSQSTKTMRLQWPCQSTAINPIVHHWDVVEREIHRINVQLTQSATIIRGNHATKKKTNNKNT